MRIVLPLKHQSTMRGSPPPPFHFAGQASKEGDKTAFPCNVVLIKYSQNFYKKVMEKYYPPLAGVNFELNTYSGFRRRIVCLFNIRMYLFGSSV
jgi:hypothetical protein